MDKSDKPKKTKDSGTATKGANKKKPSKGKSLSNKSVDFKALETKINYQFKEESLLSSALTHASSISQTQKTKKNEKTQDEDNERLEFLGDRVLGLSISAVLIKLYPESPEGDLARRYNNLVRRQTCTEVAKDLDLGKYLILSAGEERSGGRTKSTILANAMEALLGAIFLDGGYAAADEMIKTFWQGKITEGEQIELDAKTALQEWAQGQGFDLPIYTNFSRTGPDHSPIFETKVTVEGLAESGGNGEGVGKGPSKRIAEQMAAKNLLEKEKVWSK